MRPGNFSLRFMLTVVGFHATGILAAGPDICTVLPIATVNELVHENLAGARADVSEEAHSFGCAYGKGGLVSVSVIRPGRQAAFARTSSRLPKVTNVGGLGDKAIYDIQLGEISLFGDTAISAFLPQGKLTDDQLSAIEKSLILAVHSKL
jgi:hypothetical protein